MFRKFAFLIFEIYILVPSIFECLFYEKFLTFVCLNVSVIPRGLERHIYISIRAPHEWKRGLTLVSHTAGVNVRRDTTILPLEK